MSILDNIRAGLNRGELFLEYLPTMDLSNGACVGAEALVRWRRGEVILRASEFMPLVESTPLSGTLTYWVIDTVAAELGEWLGANPDVQIGINVPAEILGRGGMEYAARRSGLNARVGQIVLEITEHGIPDRLGLTALQFMAERGVRARCSSSMLPIARGP